MGKVTAKVRLWSMEQQLEYVKGIRRASEIQVLEEEGLVDTGATSLVIPQEVAQKLHLPYYEQETMVTYADGRKASKKVAYGIVLEILGRQGVFDAIVEPDGKILLGQIVLEWLDLYPNPKEGILQPRPESPDAPLIELYREQGRSWICP